MWKWRPSPKSDVSSTVWTIGVEFIKEAKRIGKVYFLYLYIFHQWKKKAPVYYMQCIAMWLAIEKIIKLPGQTLKGGYRMVGKLKRKDYQATGSNLAKKIIKLPGQTQPKYSSCKLWGSGIPVWGLCNPLILKWLFSLAQSIIYVLHMQIIFCA